MPGLLRRFLKGRTASENDQIGEGNLLSTRLGSIELLLDLGQRLKGLREFRRLVDFPILLGSKTDAGTIGATTLITAAECRGRCPGGGDQLGNLQAGAEDSALEVYDFKQKNPDLKLWEIAQRLRFTDTLNSDELVKAKKQSPTAIAKKNTMSVAVSRKLKQAETIIGNVARGLFPGPM